MSYLVDTNVLLRLINSYNSQYAQAQNAINKLIQQDVELNIVPQNLFEFWVVATRPANVNGLGLSVEEATQEMALLKQLFAIKASNPSILTVWEDLVIKYQVKGKQGHDARLVAAMITHEISHILTFNVEDFTRFSEIVAVSPQTI
jgi:predicted nucleic acid-binding protein